jgi:hypothetical protein
MARQEKLSRYRGLNPYVQKQKKENVAWYSTSASFDDRKTQSFFISTSLEAINYPTTFNVSSSYLITEISTSLTTYGRTVPQNINQYIQQQDEQLPKISPFIDIADYANDGFIIASSASFFRTGSLIENAGFGFQQPLREKNKIEIDMPLNAIYRLSSSKDQDYLMGYYNFASKSIVTVGSGSTPYDLYNSSVNISDYFVNKAIGFAPSLIDPITQTRALYGSSNIYKNQGIPTKTFGFPSDSRYKVSKDSGVLFSLSGSIKEPFLLEKIVLHIGYLELDIDGTNFNLTDYSSAIINFFILNQRNNNLYKENYEYSIAELFTPLVDFPTNIDTQDYVASTVPTVKDVKIDLITYAKIGTANKNAKSTVGRNVDLYVENSLSAPDMGFSISNTDLNLNIIQATKNDDTINFFPVLFSPTALAVLKLKGLNGTRSGVDLFSDRNWNRAFAPDASIKLLDYSNKDATPDYFSYAYYSDNDKLTIPYILLPTDNLIIGWQAPLLDLLHLIDDPDFVTNGVNFWNTNNATSTVALTGNFKLTLYGSYLRMNDELEYEEYHEYDINNESLNNISTVNIGEPIYKGDKL